MAVAFEEHLVELSDVTLYVRRYGHADTPPLVIVHGGPSWDHSYLLPAVADLADIREVVLFDLRGCGRSSRHLPLDAYGPEHQIEDLGGLVDWLGVDSVDLLGFSYGGVLAMGFLERHPAQVDRLVLASTSAYHDYRSDLSASAEYRRRTAMRAAADPALTGDEKVRHDAMRSAPLNLSSLDRLDEWRAVLSRVRFSDDWDLVREAGRYRSPMPADPAKVVREAGRPTLILHGADDYGFPVQVAHRLHDAVPETRLTVLENAGHMAHFECRDEWVGHVRRFLTS